MLLFVSDPIAEATSLFEMSIFLVYALTDTERTKYFLDDIYEN